MRIRLSTVKIESKKKGKIITSKLLRELLTVSLKLCIQQNCGFRNNKKIKAFSVEQKPRVCHQQIFTMGMLKNVFQ